MQCCTRHVFQFTVGLCIKTICHLLFTTWKREKLSKKDKPFGNMQVLISSCHAKMQKEIIKKRQCNIFFVLKDYLMFDLFNEKKARNRNTFFLMLTVEKGYSDITLIGIATQMMINLFNHPFLLSSFLTKNKDVIVNGEKYKFSTRNEPKITFNKNNKNHFCQLNKI